LRKLSKINKEDLEEVKKLFMLLFS
jgi:hypothetical protein